jgi:hypothetical protein
LGVTGSVAKRVTTSLELVSLPLSHESLGNQVA